MPGVVNVGDGAGGYITDDDNPFPGSAGVQTFTPFDGCALTDITEKNGIVTFKFNGGAPDDPTAVRLCVLQGVLEPLLPAIHDVIVRQAPYPDVVPFQVLAGLRGARMAQIVLSLLPFPRQGAFNVPHHDVSAFEKVRYPGVQQIRPLPAILELLRKRGRNTI